MKENDKAVVGVFIMATIGAIGFGLWVGSVGAAILAWVVLSIVISRVMR